MKEAFLLEELIKESNNKIKLFRKHLSDHENGENVLSKVIKASTESSLEKVNDKVKKYKSMLEDIAEHDSFSEKDKEIILEGIIRKKNYDNTIEKTKEEKAKEIPSDKKLELMLLVDELSLQLDLNDMQLFEIASKSLFLDDEEKDSLENKLSTIIQNFEVGLKKIEKPFAKSISSYNYRIPIVILHFWILIESLKTSYEKLNKEFRGLPRYEDWWLSELWSNHQAYYGVYKLKEIISLQCLSVEQKQSWDKIFDNWLSIKTYLHTKGKLAYPYMLVFDKLLSNYIGFEEETLEENLESMDTLIKNKMLKEDFTKVSEKHTTITSYMRFKKKAVLKEAIDKN